NWNFDTTGQLKAGLFISLVSVWILVGVFSYLNYYTRRKYFSIWTVAWLLYSLYLALSYSLFWLYGNFRDEPWWATMFKQWCIGIAAVFMLWGSLRFLGKSVPQLSLGFFFFFLLFLFFINRRGQYRHRLGLLSISSQAPIPRRRSAVLRLHVLGFVRRCVSFPRAP